MNNYDLGLGQKSPNYLSPVLQRIKSIKKNVNNKMLELENKGQQSLGELLCLALFSTKCTDSVTTE